MGCSVCVHDAIIWWCCKERITNLISWRKQERKWIIRVAEKESTGTKTWTQPTKPLLWNRLSSKEMLWVPLNPSKSWGGKGGWRKQKRYYHKSILISTQEQLWKRAGSQGRCQQTVGYLGRSSCSSAIAQLIEVKTNSTWLIIVVLARESVIQPIPSHYHIFLSPPLFGSDRTLMVNGVSSFPYYFSRIKASGPHSVELLPTIFIVPLKLLVSFIRKHLYRSWSLV